MVGPSLAAGQDMVHVHHSEGEVGITAHTDAFLLAIETVPVGAVVGKVSQVSAPGWGIQGNGTSPERIVFNDSLLDQLYGQR